jgi:transcriptional regulator with XRE-family HTH domain
MTKGTRLEMIRTYLRLNQKQMSEKLGLQQSQYSKLENDRSGFSDESISILADMGFNVHWLFTGHGSMLLAAGDGNMQIESVKKPEPPEHDVEEGFVEEMEERIRRLKVDAMDIEETFRRMLRRKKG